MNSVLSGGLSVALVCGTSVALADADLDADLRKLRGQLVVIQATATPVGAAGPPRSYRMGFVASDDGLVLTTYDLLNSLGQFNSGTLEIKVALATPETRPDRDYQLADIYSEDLKHKLLLLHVKGLTRDNPLKLSFSSTLAVGTLLATLGYDDKGKFQTPSGTGATETGVLWETGIKIDSNQAGAPVYSSANRNIIGVIQEKGLNGMGIVVPMYVARPLLLPISVTDDEVELGQVERQFQWNLVPSFLPDANVKLRLCYDNFIPTSLSPSNVSVTPTFSYYDRNEQFQQRHGFQKLPIVLPPEGAAPPTSEGASPQSQGASPDCGGSFNLSQILDDADRYKDQDRPDTMDISLSVVVTLNDNKQLPAKHFHIHQDHLNKNKE